MKYVVASICLLVLGVLFAGVYRFNFSNDDIYVLQEDGTVIPYDASVNNAQGAIDRGQRYERDLIVIAAPSVTHEYYEEVFDEIVEFDVAYAHAVLGHDDIRILVDKETRAYFAGKVPDEILIEASLEDIWMRDFTTINPHTPIQFRYTAASFDGDQDEADVVQKSFTAFTDKLGLTYPKTDYLLDGGNIVDNHAGRVVATTRFLEDNDLTREEGVKELKRLLGPTEVALVSPDDDALAHSDGMVLFVDADTIMVNRYDEPFRAEVLEELRSAFPGIQIIEVETVWDDEMWDETIGSACGIHVNATVTTNYMYMPHFGGAVSDEALAKIQAHTTKTVIPIPAQNVCKMGGSVRCLSWQQSGAQAEKVRMLMDSR